MQYFIRHPQDFANQYIVGVATTDDHAAQYVAEDFTRITRREALSRMCYRGDRATDAYVSASVDGRDAYSRFELARAIRTGGNVAAQ